MRKLCILMISILSAFACSKSEKPVEYGRVTLNIEQGAGAFVEVKNTTKAVDAIPDTYLIATTTNDGAPVAEGTGTYGAVKNGFTLPSGSGYILKAYNCTEDEAVSQPDAWGQQRFVGSTSFNVIPGQTTDITFTCTMVNAKVSIEYDASFTSQFDNYSAVVYAEAAPDRKLTFDAGATLETPAAFFNISASDPTLKIEISATRKIGNLLKKFTQSVKLEAQSWHKITIKATATNVSAKLRASGYTLR